jgi:ubiquinone/menaquinone biosynthesis C-methylase UbiE
MPSSISQIIKEKTALGLNSTRALLYTLESLPLPLLNSWITGQERQQITPEQQKYIIQQSRRLLELDAFEVGQGVYPFEVLKPEEVKSPLTHLSRLAWIMGDSTKSFWRRRHQETQVFSDKVKDLEHYPSYYQRNFHHQTDGYLSDTSAWLYEHQVELLFRGLANPMRRRILKPMSEALSKVDNPRILELACGTGTFTRQLAKTFPHSRITAIDLSPNYIHYAKKRFLDMEHVDFMVADSEHLPFMDQKYDAVVSVFLHHELPQKVRERVIDQSLRVLKPNGFWGLVDSIQLNDDPELNWAIEAFPKTFHEPFFTNYIKKDLLKYVKRHHPERQFKQKTHLLSKVLYAGPDEN